MNEKQARRCLKLAKVLMKVPKEDFDMDRWSSWRWDRSGTVCGTSCCVLGHAACVPEFNEEGLKWLGGFLTINNHTRPTGSISYDRCYEAGAGRKFFGLTAAQTRQLFYDFSVTDPKVMARRLRGFVKAAFPEGLPRPKKSVKRVAVPAV